jgi:membrane-anchored protein YejM (alkaline phosphatase superfamily)
VATLGAFSVNWESIDMYSLNSSPSFVHSITLIPNSSRLKSSWRFFFILVSLVSLCAMLVSTFKGPMRQYPSKSMSYLNIPYTLTFIVDTFIKWWTSFCHHHFTPNTSTYLAPMIPSHLESATIRNYSRTSRMHLE